MIERLFHHALFVFMVLITAGIFLLVYHWTFMYLFIIIYSSHILLDAIESLLYLFYRPNLKTQYQNRINQLIRGLHTIIVGKYDSDIRRAWEKGIIYLWKKRKWLLLMGLLGRGCDKLEHKNEFGKYWFTTDS
jgi:hypothetical protein